MAKNKDKKLAEKQIYEFFKEIGEKRPEEIRKVKRLAMHYNIKLEKLNRRFCKKCYSTLNNSRKRINRGKITITCLKCGHIMRYPYKK
ncbi:hypothetical protein HZA33_01415 [Candidatus Pacearchaeota archaeon]|nr:hypothetical protein [Candidatus Pacearchaeota archaeon]